MGDGGRGKCLVCNDDRQAEIDRSLVAEVPYRKIAEQFGISKTALLRHKAAHLSPALAKVRRAQEARGARTLTERLEQMLGLAEGFLVAAHGAGNISQALAAMREMRATLELVARVTGELDMRPTTVINLQSTQEWIQVRALVVEFVPEDRRLEFSQRLELLEGGAA